MSKRNKPEQGLHSKPIHGESRVKPVASKPTLRKVNNPRASRERTKEHASVSGSYDVASQGRSTEATATAAKRMSRGKKIVIGIVIAIALIVAGTVTAMALYLNNINNNLAFEDEAEFQELKEALAPVAADDNSSYVLILGSDARSGDTVSRSDVIILARLDPDDGIAEMVSIPRDTMVTIPGHGTEKINAAYAYGGASGAVECVSEFAGVPISHYVEVHFEELKEVVDRLGGITVDIPQDIVAGNGGKSFSKGEQLIDGEQALAFARERYHVSGGDFGRAYAQRMILQAIVKRVVDSPVTEIPGLVTELSSCVSTDFTVSDLIDLALKYREIGLTMYTVACPSYSQSINGVSYVCTMFDEWQDVMRRVDAGMDPKGSDPIPQPQASDAKLGAAANSPAPRDYHGIAANALSTDDIAGDE